MNGAILGFQKRVWWPKWTPASSISRMVIVMRKPIPMPSPTAIVAPITPIPASELVRATSRLYRRGRSLGYAARVMRESTRARMGRRFGVEAAEKDWQRERLSHLDVRVVVPRQKLPRDDLVHADVADTSSREELVGALEDPFTYRKGGSQLDQCAPTITDRRVCLGLARL